MKILPKPIIFEWDEGNSWKPIVHDVDVKEAEQAFFDTKKIIYRDIFHSKAENRYIVLGKSKKRRILYIAFTIRKGSIRIISARDINKKEVHLYEKTT